MLAGAGAGVKAFECGVLKWPQLTLSLNGQKINNTRAETTAGARARAVSSTCPVSSARERTDERATPHHNQHSARHWAAVTNKYPPLLDKDIDISDLRNAHLDTTRRAQTRSASETHEQSSTWIRKRKIAIRAACLPRVRRKMPGRVLAATRLAAEAGRATNTSTWARLAGESDRRKSVYRKDDTDVATAKLALSS